MYDFKSLSAYDFELLVRDLIQLHFGITLESFKSGRDEGIDLRYAPSNDNKLIIQCKHYAQTGYSGLLSSLKKEVVKVHRLKPSRYCVACSVPMSPANKKEIRKLFEPYCLSDQDIFGLEDLNNLLGIYKEIERKHYKLWLTSTSVLENILHSSIFNQTKILVEEIQDKAKLYVQNESFFDAQDLLKEYNYCIISGIPGIGKTFLAEILLLQYISLGYQPIVVRSHINEAFELLKSSVKQVFYYDDFLGQTGWDDKLEKNEEQSILDFVKYVKHHEHAKFILTTREYILQQARSVYEKIYSSDFDNAKCVVQLESYNRRDKAHILYNHLYFSKLPPSHIRSLIHKKSLLEIVDHKNYSPRIIEWMSNHHNVRGCTAPEYPKLFVATLSNPRELWRHAFRNHISPASRALLVVLVTFPLDADYYDLMEAFESFRLQEIKQFGITTSSHEFVSALDELEGSFVRCDRKEEEIIVSFHNPSVRDFLEQYLAENADILRMLCLSIIFYDQFRALCTKRKSTNNYELISTILAENHQVVAEAITRSVQRTAKKKRTIELPDGRVVCTTHVQTSIEKNIAHALNHIKSIPEINENISLQLIESEKQRLENDEISLGELNDVLELNGGRATLSV